MLLGIIFRYNWLLTFGYIAPRKWSPGGKFLYWNLVEEASRHKYEIYPQ